MAVSTPNKYPVKLTAEQRRQFQEITRNGQSPARKMRHAQVLLWSDGDRPGGRLKREEIAQRLEMHINTVDRIRKRFVLEGEEPALNRKPRATPPVPPKVDGHVQTKLAAICCGQAPEGRTRWTLQLLAQELKERGLVTSVCVETVRRALKKINCSPGGSSAGAYRNGTRPGSSPRWKKSSTYTRRSTRPKNR